MSSAIWSKRAGVLLLTIVLCGAGVSFAERYARAQQPAQQKRHFLLLLHNDYEKHKAHITEEQFGKLIGEHFALLKQRYAEGKIVLAGPRIDEAYGVVILEVSTPEEAQAIAQDDPCVKAGVFRAELHEVRLALLRGATPVPKPAP